MRTRSTLALAVVVLMAALTACGGDGDQSQPPIVIVVPTAGGDTQGGASDSVGTTQTTDGNEGGPEDEGDDGIPPEDDGGGPFLPPHGGWELPPVTGNTLIDLDRLRLLCLVCRGLEDRIWDIELPDDLGTVPHDITQVETEFGFDRARGVIIGHTWIETLGGNVDVSVVVILSDAAGAALARTEPQVWHIGTAGNLDQEWTSPVVPFDPALEAADVVAEVTSYSVFQGSGSVEALTALTQMQWTQAAQEIGIEVFQ